MHNTIILLKGEETLTNKYEMKNFEKGDSIWGNDSTPEELKRWSMEEETEAKAELAKYKNSYSTNDVITYIEEYALEYCACDEDGEFLEGSDYELAEER